MLNRWRGDHRGTEGGHRAWPRSCAHQLALPLLPCFCIKPPSPSPHHYPCLPRGYYNWANVLKRHHPFPWQSVWSSSSFWKFDPSGMVCLLVFLIQWLDSLHLCPFVLGACLWQWEGCSGHTKVPQRAHPVCVCNWQFRWILLTLRAPAVSRPRPVLPSTREGRTSVWAGGRHTRALPVSLSSTRFYFSFKNLKIFRRLSIVKLLWLFLKGYFWRWRPGCFVWQCVLRGLGVRVTSVFLGFVCWMGALWPVPHLKSLRRQSGEKRGEERRGDRGGKRKRKGKEQERRGGEGKEERRGEEKAVTVVSFLQDKNLVI